MGKGRVHPNRPLPTISPSTRGRLIKMLDDWKFEPHKLPDDEVLACTQLLFESLMRVEGMQEAVGVTMGTSSGSLAKHIYLTYGLKTLLYINDCCHPKIYDDEQIN